MQATELLKKQHRSVHGLFGEPKRLDGAGRRTVMDRISDELAHHMAIEEGIFYQRGAAGWGLLWWIGIPVPVLLALFLMRGST